MNVFRSTRQFQQAWMNKQVRQQPIGSIVCKECTIFTRRHADGDSGMLRRVVFQSGAVHPPGFKTLCNPVTVGSPYRAQNRNIAPQLSQPESRDSGASADLTGKFSSKRLFTQLR